MPAPVTLQLLTSALRHKAKNTETTVNKAHEPSKQPRKPTQSPVTHVLPTVTVSNDLLAAQNSMYLLLHTCYVCVVQS